MKKGITLAMCLAFVACGMLAAGCAEEHVHNWSSDWKSDSTGHWQTCDGCDEKNGSAAHSGGTATCTEKAECEVCGEAYGELAAHSYTVLKSDEDSHWLECLCGAKDEASDEAHSGGTANCQQGALCEDCGVEYTAAGDHAYTIPSGNDTQHWLECVCGDKDETTLGDHTGGTATCTNKAECGTCGMPYGALAAHEYTVEGSDATQHWMECACGAKDESTVVDHTYTVAGSDENKHWNACVCGAKDPASEGAHTAANAIGQCDTCGYQINDFSIEDILEMIEDNASKVKMGTTTHNTKTDTINASETNIYEYRNGYLYIQNCGQLFEDYNTIKSDGTPFSIRVSAPDTDNGETEPKIAVNPYGCTLDDVRGFRFDPVIIDDIMSFYGAEELVLNLYDEAQYDDNGDLEVSFKLEGGKIVAAYKFGYHDIDGYFFYLTVDFTLAADGWLETVDIYSYKYGAGKYEKDGEYYVATGNADYIYHITVIQSNECENADVENPYAPEKIYVQSFDMMTAATGGTALGDVLEVEAATSQVRYYLQNVTPSTAIAELNPVTFEIDGEAIGFFDTRLMVNYSKEGGYLGIRPNELVGEYPLTIKVGDASKTVLVKVLAATPTSLTANVFDGVVYNKTTTASTYEGMNVRFNAVANVAYADASFTAEITSSNAADATLTWDSEAGEYVFNSATIGEYTIKLTSTKAPSVTSTLTVSVNELPDVASILSGEYEYAMMLGEDPYVVYTAAFTPDTTAEGISGTVEVTWNGQGTVVYAYTYDAANGLQLTKTSGADITTTIGLSEEFALYIENNGSQYALTKKTAGGEEGGGEDDKSPMYSYAVILSGVHSQSVNVGMVVYNAIVTFKPAEMTDTKLTGMFTLEDPQLQNAEYEFSYEYTVDGGFVATSATDFSSGDYSYAVTLDSNMAIVVSKTKKNGSTYNFTCTQDSSDPDAYTAGGGSGEEGGEEGATSGTISVTTTDTYAWADEYTFTATAAGKYTFTVPAGLGVYSQAAWDSFSAAEVDYNTSPDGGSFSVVLAAGEEYVYNVGAFTKGDWTITWTYEEVSEEPAETSGTISVTTTDNNCYVDEYTFTATAAGTYSFYVPAGLGFYSKAAYDVWGDAELDYMLNAEGGYVEVTLAAGEEYVFYVGSETKTDWTITWSIKAEEEGGDVTPSSKQLVVGENTINVTDDDITAGAIEGYTFTVTQEGTYSFAHNALVVRVYVTETEFHNVTAYLMPGTYKVVIITAYASIAGTYVINATYEAPVADTTLEVGTNNIEITEDILTAGGVEYTFVADADGDYTFRSNDLIVRVSDEDDNQLGMGTLTLTAGTYKVTIATQLVSSAGTYQVTVTYTAPATEAEPDGSESNPYVWDTFPESLLVTESNASNFTYYTFTVTEAGVYVFTFDTTDTWYNLANAEGTVLDGASGSLKESFEADLAVGTYRIALGNWDVTAPLTVTASVKAAGGGDSGSTETAGTAIRLTLNGKYAGEWSSASKIALVADQASAVTYYMEEAGDGNYYIYFLKDGVAQYLYLNNANMSASIGTTTDKATAHTWTFDAENQRIVNTTYTSRALYYHTDAYMRAYSIDAADAASKAWTWFETV